MPQTAESTATREGILEAAEHLFAKQGFTKTTIKDIGTAAQSNPALIYYYFGSKDSLYEAVIERLAEGLRSRAAGAWPAEGGRRPTPPEVIERLVAGQSAFLAEHPAAPALMIREMLDHDGQRAGAFLPVATELFRRVRGTIEEGQRQGLFTEEVDARFGAISVVAQLLYFRLARAVVRRLLESDDPDFPSTELQHEFARHAAAFGLRGLGRDPAGGQR
ncbi:MAG: TetR/AcrR family transcriptional regulator [Gemmatimonadales bacterium]